eukprot:6202078-Pleurochrysis_carterae.AAC.2
MAGQKLARLPRLLLLLHCSCGARADVAGWNYTLGSESDRLAAQTSFGISVVDTSWYFTRNALVPYKGCKMVIANLTVVENKTFANQIMKFITAIKPPTWYVLANGFHEDGSLLSGLIPLNFYHLVAGWTNHRRAVMANARKSGSSYKLTSEFGLFEVTKQEQAAVEFVYESPLKGKVAVRLEASSSAGCPGN